MTMFRLLLLIQVGGPPGPMFEMLAAAVLVIVVGAVLYPIARAFARRIEKGAGSGAGLSPDAQSRLDRLEQSVDAMAIEIERISEGQRYTTKLITERLPLAVKVPDKKNVDKTLL